MSVSGLFSLAVISAVVSALPAPVEVEVVCGGGLRGLRMSDPSSHDCHLAFETINREVHLPAALSDFVDISFRPQYGERQLDGDALERQLVFSA